MRDDTIVSFVAEFYMCMCNMIPDIATNLKV